MVTCFLASSAWQPRRFRVCNPKILDFVGQPVLPGKHGVPGSKHGSSGWQLTELSSFFLLSCWVLNLEVPDLSGHNCPFFCLAVV